MSDYVKVVCMLVEAGNKEPNVTATMLQKYAPQTFKKIAEDYQ